MPVFVDTRRAHEFGDVERRVARKRRSDHRGAGDPPRQRAARKEIFFRRAVRAFGHHQPDDQADDIIGDNDRPVEGVEIAYSDKFLISCGSP